MNNKVQNIVLGVLAVALIGITVAYATLTQHLKYLKRQAYVQ